MKISRRGFLAAGSAILATPFLARTVWAAAGGRALPVPPLAPVGEGTEVLRAAYGQSRFIDGVTTPSWGYSQPYLGPTLRFTRGQNARMLVENRLKFPITCHWHGLHVPGRLDGGPQLSIAPGEDWQAELPIDQPATTLWYHSHSHGVTAEQVYGGLAGLILIDDPAAGDEGLPADYGVDDLPLIVQDRAFSDDGGLYHVKRGPALMHGFRADQIMVNGAIRPVASVPAGLTRLRILNASNARIYHFSFEDGRGFHQVAADGGLLAAPVARDTLSLAPAERAEIVVDFSDGGAVRLLSAPDFNDPMAGAMMMGGGGMMGRMLPPPPPEVEGAGRGVFEVMRFAPDTGLPAKVTALPARFASAPAPEFGAPVRRRRFELNMHGGMGMGMGMGMGGMGRMNINGEPFDMKRIDVEMHAGETELWHVLADEMAHPFHVHGTHYRVLTHNGQPQDFASTGLKDTFLVNGEAELLVNVTQKADADIPFMFHCHILEHEDAGMMGQFTVA